MNVARLLTSTATVTGVADTGADDLFGDPTESTTTATFACWLHQEQRSEETANTDTQRERWTLYLDASAAGLVDGGDRVTVDDVVYEMDGPSWPALNPRTQVVTHVECTVRRTQ